MKIDAETVLDFLCGIQQNRNVQEVARYDLNILSVLIVLDIAEQVTGKVMLLSCEISSHVLQVPQLRSRTITRLELHRCDHQLVEQILQQAMGSNSRNFPCVK